MLKQKHFFLYIFCLLLPSSAILAQADLEEDTTAQTELDIKYDSVLAKAATSITTSNYTQAITFYKEASALKPAETFPYKMILYAEELAARQLHEEDLKRKAQLKDDLFKANQAIVNRQWDTARALFSKILTLQPEKAEEEYAKSKISAIDLELKRIALRTPPPPPPVVVVLPKNKREARAQRKLAERNAILASSAAAIIQKQAAVLPTQKNIAAAPVKEIPKKQIEPSLPQRKMAVPLNKVLQQKPLDQSNVTASGTNAPVSQKVSYQILQSFNADFKNARNVSWLVTTRFATASFFEDEEKVEAVYDLNGTLIGTSRYLTINELPKEARRNFTSQYPQYAIQEVVRFEGSEEVGYLISTIYNNEKVIFRLTGSRNITVISRELANGPTLAGTTTNTGIQQKAPKVQTNASTAANPLSNKSLLQKQIETSRSQNTVSSAAVTKVTEQKPTETPVQQRSVANAPAIKVTEQKPAETPVQQKSVVNAPAIKVTEQKPAETPVQQKSVVNAPSIKVTEQKPTETPVLQKSVVNAPAIKVTEQKPTETPLQQGNVVSAPATKVTEQKARQTPLTQKSVTNTPVPPVTEQKRTETTLPQRNVNSAPALKGTAQKSTETTLPSRNLGAIDSLPKETPFPSESSSQQFADSADYTKLICKDITFIGTNAYIKVLVQNYSETTNFLTDTLRVSIKKNNGSVIKLDQRFISSFPVIGPLGESVLVSFADAAGNINLADIFILEMTDKTKKTTLSVQVPWAAYQQQKNL